jgi:DNA-binding IclR family transcriptional regulator
LDRAVIVPVKKQCADETDNGAVARENARDAAMAIALIIWWARLNVDPKCCTHWVDVIKADGPPMLRSKELKSDIDPAAPPRASEPAKRPAREPQNHRTVDRVTHILEQVVYKPGMTFAELARALEAPKSSVYGFIRGLLAKGWLYEQDRRFYLGPAVYGLTLASGHIRAGLVTHADLAALHEESGVAVFLGVQAGDHLIYIAEAAGDTISDIEARSNIRRTLIMTAGGKALLAAWSDSELNAYLRRRGPEEAAQVEAFLGEYEEIRKTRIATNIRLSGTRFGIATTVNNRSGETVAAVTLVGRTVDLQPRLTDLSKLLLRHVDSWSKRSARPREAI